MGRGTVPLPAAADLTIAEGAAPSATLTGVLIVFVAAVALVLPALGLLYALAQRDLIGDAAGPRPDEEHPS